MAVALARVPIRASFRRVGSGACTFAGAFPLSRVWAPFEGVWMTVAASVTSLVVALAAVPHPCRRAGASPAAFVAAFAPVSLPLRGAGASLAVLVSSFVIASALASVMNRPRRRWASPHVVPVATRVEVGVPVVHPACGAGAYVVTLVSSFVVAFAPGAVRAPLWGVGSWRRGPSAGWGAGSPWPVGVEVLVARG